MTKNRTTIRMVTDQVWDAFHDLKKIIPPVVQVAKKIKKKPGERGGPFWGYTKEEDQFELRYRQAPHQDYGNAWGEADKDQPKREIWWQLEGLYRLLGRLNGYSQMDEEQDFK